VDGIEERRKKSVSGRRGRQVRDRKWLGKSRRGKRNGKREDRLRWV